MTQESNKSEEDGLLSLQKKLERKYQQSECLHINRKELGCSYGEMWSGEEEENNDQTFINVFSG